MKFMLEMNTQFPNWKFEDEYDDLDELIIRISDSMKIWKNDFKKFEINVTKLEEQK